MSKTNLFFYLYSMLAILVLSGCGGSTPAAASLLESRANNGSDQINVVVELPTEAVAASAALADTVQTLAENQENVADLQVTVESMADTLSEIATEITPTLESAVAPTAVVVDAQPDAIPETNVEVAVATRVPQQPPAPAPTPIPIYATDLDSLKAKMSQAVPDENGQVSVTINQDELNQVIQSATDLSQADNISNVTFRFTGGMIIFEATITRPVSGDLYISFVPYVSGNTLQFEVAEVSLDGKRVPPATVAMAEATLNSTLGEAMNQLPQNVILTDIIVGEGYMTVLGQVQG
ncbi:MAG: hypothetical protein AAF633_10230 [Chloroflexota bacterium]